MENKDYKVKELTVQEFEEEMRSKEVAFVELKIDATLQDKLMAFNTAVELHKVAWPGLKVVTLESLWQYAKTILNMIGK